MKRLLLLSGGIDSMALGYLIRPDHAITVDYGQKAADAEVEASTIFCREIGLSHEVVRIDCSPLGLGVMRRGLVESQEGVATVAPTPEWWPYRNQLLATMAAARAVALGADEVCLGSVCSDREHRDGLPAFYRLLDALIGFQEGSVRVSAPAIDMESAELVRRSGIGADLLSWSHSCHVGNVACGLCRGCTKHTLVFEAVFNI